MYHPSRSPFSAASMHRCSSDEDHLYFGFPLQTIAYKIDLDRIPNPPYTQMKGRILILKIMACICKACIFNAFIAFLFCHNSHPNNVITTCHPPEDGVIIEVCEHSSHLWKSKCVFMIGIGLKGVVNRSTIQYII